MLGVIHIVTKRAKDFPGRVYDGGFSPPPSAPALLALRLAVSGAVAPLPGLRRVHAFIASNTRLSRSAERRAVVAEWSVGRYTGGMKAFGWHELAWAIAVLGAALAAYVLFRTPEPARTGLELVAAVCGSRQERAQSVERHVAVPLAVSIPDISETGGERNYSPEELLLELEQLNGAWPRCELSLHDWTIRPAANGSAWLEGSLEYSDSQPSDLHGQRRSVRALFRGADDVPRLERLLVGPIERREPEARP
jgi:hypothetical protein